jgi:hypothetical protein
MVATSALGRIWSAAIDFPGAIVQRSGGPRATALLLALGGKHVQGVRIRQIDCWYGKYHCSELALKVVHAAEKPTSQRGKPLPGIRRSLFKSLIDARRACYSVAPGAGRGSTAAISSTRRVLADAMPQMRIVREETSTPCSRPTFRSAARNGRVEPPIGSGRVWCRPTDTPFGSYKRSGNAVSSVRESRSRIRRPFASWPSGSSAGGCQEGLARQPRPLASVRRPAPEPRTRSPDRAPF